MATSIRAALEEALEKQQQPTETQETVETSEPEEQIEEVVEDSETTAAETDTKEDTSSKTEPKDKEKQADSEPKTVKPVQDDKGTLKPPASWRKDAKTKWDKLPYEVKKELLAREQQYNRGIEAKGTEANFARTIKARLEPYRELMQQQGMDEAAAVSYLMDMNDLATRDPLGFIKRYMDAYGIDVSHVAQYAQTPQQGYSYDPQLEQMKREFAQLQESINGQESQNIATAIQDFETKDFPYYEEVKDEMVRLLRDGSINAKQSYDKMMEDAYNQAIYALPHIREQVINERIQQEMNRKMESSKAKVMKAKNAAISVTGSPGGTVNNTQQPKSIRQHLEDNLAAQLGRL